MKTTVDKDLKKLKKINFGCGWDKRSGFLNVDVDEACTPDLLVKNGDYGVIPINHYKEILANDVLEHISHAYTQSVLLDWAEFLKKGGTLHIQTSSILGVAAQLTKAKTFQDQIGWTICLFGNQAHSGDFHHIGFTEATLKTNLIAAGFTIDSFELKDKWLFHVDTRKTEDWTKILGKTSRLSDEEYIDAIFEYSLGREPDYMGRTHILQSLQAGSMNRREALRHLMQSRERLYNIARQNGL